jgi:hypothetical protein
VRTALPLRRLGAADEWDHGDRGDVILAAHSVVSALAGKSS